MKKIFIALVLVMLAVFSASCGKDQSELPDYETNDIASKKEDNISSKPITKEKTSSKSKNLVSELTLKEYEELNRYISTFTSHYLGNYSANDYTEKQLFNWFLWYNLSNDNKIYFETDYDLAKSMGIAKDDAEKAYVTIGFGAREFNEHIDKYLGKQVELKSYSNWKYKNDYFYTLELITSPDTFDYSLVTSFVDNGDGTYNVEFTNIWCNGVNPRYDKTPEKVLENPINNGLIGYGTAVIKDKIYNGEKTYELVEYSVDGMYF